MTLLCKKYIVANSKEVKTGFSLRISSKEGSGSKKVVLPTDDSFNNTVSI
jgi:hypothetical protein